MGLTRMRSDVMGKVNEHSSRLSLKGWLSATVVQSVRVGNRVTREAFCENTTLFDAHAVSKPNSRGTPRGQGCTTISQVGGSRKASVFVQHISININLKILIINSSRIVLPYLHVKRLKGLLEIYILGAPAAVRRMKKCNCVRLLYFTTQPGYW